MARGSCTGRPKRSGCRVYSSICPSLSSPIRVLPLTDTRPSLPGRTPSGRGARPGAAARGSGCRPGRHGTRPSGNWARRPGCRRPARRVLRSLDSPVEIRFYSLLDESSVSGSVRAFWVASTNYWLNTNRKPPGRSKSAAFKPCPPPAPTRRWRMASGLLDPGQGQGLFPGHRRRARPNKRKLFPRWSRKWEQALEPDLNRAIARAISGGFTGGAVAYQVADGDHAGGGQAADPQRGFEFPPKKARRRCARLLSPSSSSPGNWRCKQGRRRPRRVSFRRRPDRVRDRRRKTALQEIPADSGGPELASQRRLVSASQAQLNALQQIKASGPLKRRLERFNHLTSHRNSAIFKECEKAPASGSGLTWLAAAWFDRQRAAVCNI